MFGSGTFLFVHEMTILLRDYFGTVFDFKNFTGTGSRIRNHHIKLTYRKLQDKNMVFWKREPGFEKHDILHHTSLDFIQYAVKNGIALCKGKIGKFLVQ